MLKVSVIIPCYNAEDFIKEAIESVLSQSFQNFEILVVDNNSKDQSKAIIESFQDDRVKYLKQEIQGEAAARNKGIEEASGEYIAFLDADDLWKTNKLEEHIKIHDANPDYGLSYSNCDYMLKDDGTLHTMIRLGFTGTVYYNLLAENFIITPSSVVVKKSVLDKVGNFNNTYINGTDYDMWLRIAKKHKIIFLEEPLSIYRQHDGQITHTTDIERIIENNKTIIETNLVDHFDFFEHVKLTKLKKQKINYKFKYLFFIRKILQDKITKAVKQKDYPRFFGLIKANLFLYYAGLYMTAHDYRQSIEHLKQAFQYNPEIALDLFWLKRFVLNHYKEVTLSR